jgi:hypothetical protein
VSAPGRDPADEPASADRDEHGVGIGHLLRELDPDRSLPRDDLRLVERVHDERTGLGRTIAARADDIGVEPVDDRDVGAFRADQVGLDFR